MTKTSVIKNYIYNLSYQILSLIIPVVTIPYLSRVLGAENIGIYSFTLSVTTYFILFGSLGVDMYGQREIAYLQNDKEKRSKAFYEIFIIKLICLMASLIIFYFTFCVNGNYSVYYRILILEIVANSMDVAWFFKGLEEFKKTVMRNILAKVISLMCIFLFVKDSSDLNIYLLIYVLSTSIGNLSIWFYLPKYLSKIKIEFLNFRKHIKPILLLFVPQIATQIYTVLDKTMIGIIISDKSEVGYYEQAQKVIKLLMTLATSLGTVMMPRIASSYASGDFEKIKSYMKSSFAFIMMISFPIMFGLISVAYKFVPIFFGPGYDKVAPLLCIISPVMIIMGLSNVIGIQFLLPTRQQNKYTISVILGSSLNIILNLFLIRQFASIGASISTIVAELAIMITQFFIVRKEIMIFDVLKLSKNYFISSLIMFVCSLIIGSFISNNYISIIIQIMVSSIVYISILKLLHDSFLLKTIRFLKKKL